MRRFGNPKWVASHEYRVYPEGWVKDDDARDSTLEYRLSIIHAVEDDSGIFTCQTPARHEHKIDIAVKVSIMPFYILFSEVLSLSTYCKRSNFRP